MFGGLFESILDSNPYSNPMISNYYGEAMERQRMALNSIGSSLRVSHCPDGYGYDPSTDRCEPITFRAELQEETNKWLRQ